MLFPGGGAQYPSMGADLYREEPRYRADVDRCLSIAESLGHVGLGRLMFPPAAEARDAAALLERPGTSILSVFVTEYALARLWMSWGIQPAAYIGHSLGEYVAACLAGVMTLESALALVAKRGAIFERLPEGGMLSVSCNERALRELPEAKALAVAAVNASELTVASGAVNDLAALEAALTSRGIESRRLHISVAAHSSMLDPFLDEFGAFLRTIPLMPPTQRFISNVTGSWVDGREVATPEYWVRHLRNTVRFSDGLTTILREPNGLLLEVGPGQSLTALARLNRVNGQVPDVFPSLRQPREAVSDLKTIYLALARLWVEGCPIDWNAVYEGQTRRRVDLPTYAFDRQHHWIAPGRTSVAERPESTTPPLLPRSNSIDDWAYTPTWQALPEPAAAPASRETWLVFARGARGRAFAAALRARGDSVTTVTPGVSFAEHTAGFVVRPKLVEDYRALWHALDNSGRMPSRIAYLWLADEADDDAPLDSSISPSATALFEAQFAALQALAENAGETAVQILTVTSGLFSVMGEAVQRPEQALLHGVALVMPREYPMWRCRVIDVAAPGAAESDATSREWAVQLLREASRHDAASLVALRNGRAWLRLFERQPLPDGGRSVAFREGGVYLIAGGLGGMALTIARHLADRYQAKLGLVSRHLTADRIAVTDELATRGARVLPLAADVSVPQDIARAVGELERSYGPINGVIHAAGVLDDGLLAMRSTEQAQAVLMPKVQGALALDNALSGRNLDFFVVCSSMSALVGLPGQIDYAAANAFLDSFAEHRSRWAKGTTLSINWGTWRDVGMAHRAMSRVAPQSSGITTPRDHPLLGRVTSSSESTIEFELRANAHDLWVLSEHRLRDGTPMFPGSAYVELLRAAGEVASGAPVVELENLTFVEALDVTQPRTIRTRLERRDTDGWEAVVESAADALGSWTEHARADVKGLATVSHAAVEPLSAVQARLLPTLAPTDRDVWEKQSKHMAFGPRWNVLDALHVGKNEALARLSLDRRFAADLQIWRLHPALLDLATAAGLSALPDYAACDDFFVPLAYARVVAASFDRELWAHTRLAPGSEGAETVTLDVTIFDAEGHAVATIEGFTMRRLEPRQFTASRATREARKPVPMTPAALSASLLDRGISAAEGAVALERVLAANLGPHVVLSPIDLSALAAAVDRVYPARTTTSPGGSAGVPLGARKSSLDPVESAIAELWEELLGGVEFSVDDDFFKLGGHSLTAVRLITRMERTFHAGLRVSAIFEAPTIRQLAALVRTSVHNRGTPPGTTDTMQVTTQPAAKPVPPLVAVSREAFLVSHTTWTDDEHDA
jgi:acyl transferase domain-containing protein